MKQADGFENARGLIDAAFRVVEMVGIVALLHALLPDGPARHWTELIGIGLITSWITLPLTARVGPWLYARRRGGLFLLVVGVGIFGLIGMALERSMITLSDAIERHDEKKG